MMTKRSLSILLLLLFGGIAFTFGFSLQRGRVLAKATTASEIELSSMTVAELSHYDGSDPNKPIYIGMNGLVYDVTAGKEFYIPGGPYHDLAGKDSSAELNLFGGGIIKKKYPVIAKLIN